MPVDTFIQNASHGEAVVIMDHTSFAHIVAVTAAQLLSICEDNPDPTKPPQGSISRIEEDKRQSYIVSLAEFLKSTVDGMLNHRFPPFHIQEHTQLVINALAAFDHWYVERRRHHYPTIPHSYNWSARNEEFRKYTELTHQPAPHAID